MGSFLSGEQASGSQRLPPPGTASVSVAPWPYLSRCLNDIRSLSRRFLLLFSKGCFTQRKGQAG